MLEEGRKSAAEVARLFGVHPATVSRLAARARNTARGGPALADDFEQILR
jgi:transposase-like protein